MILVPRYADRGNEKFLCSRRPTVLLRLLSRHRAASTDYVARDVLLKNIVFCASSSLKQENHLTLLLGREHPLPLIVYVPEKVTRTLQILMVADMK